MEEARDGDAARSVAEPREDCAAMRESLAARRDDNILIPRDDRELRENGC